MLFGEGLAELAEVFDVGEAAAFHLLKQLLHFGDGGGIAAVRGVADAGHALVGVDTDENPIAALVHGEAEDFQGGELCLGSGREQRCGGKG